MKMVPKLEGKIVELIPYAHKYNADIINIRNLDESKYYLSQSMDLSVENQEKWGELYFKRENDYYWIITCKESGDFIGTTSLYDLNENKVEKGRLVVDPTRSLGKPFVLEAELLIIDYAFSKLKVEKIITFNKNDNLKMQSINKRLGFVRDGQTVINGNAYFKFVLNKENAKIGSDKFLKVIDKWVKRN